MGPQLEQMIKNKEREIDFIFSSDLVNSKDQMFFSKFFLQTWENLPIKPWKLKKMLSCSFVNYFNISPFIAVNLRIFFKNWNFLLSSNIIQHS